jgi:hypothetical protein
VRVFHLPRGCLVSAHADIAVGRLVVEVRADRLCRLAALRALMRATDLCDGGPIGILGVRTFLVSGQCSAD